MQSGYLTRRNFILQTNSMVKKFRTITFQFEDKIDALVLWNSTTGALSWIQTSNTSISVVGSSNRSFSRTLTYENEVDGNAGRF